MGGAAEVATRPPPVARIKARKPAAAVAEEVVADCLNAEMMHAVAAEDCGTRGRAAAGAAAATADLPAPSEPGQDAALTRAIHYKVQECDRFRFGAAEAAAAGLCGEYRRWRVNVPDLQREMDLSMGWYQGKYKVQQGWTALRSALGLSAGMGVILSIEDGRIRSIQKQACPADPAPSSSAPVAVARPQSTGGPSSELRQQLQQPTSAAPPAQTLRGQDGASEPRPEAHAQAAALPRAAARLGVAVFEVFSLDGRQRLPKELAQAAFPGYLTQPSSVRVPGLRRSFPVSMGWASDGRFSLGAGWLVLITAWRLQKGAVVQLSRTGEASFSVEIRPNAVAKAPHAQQEAATHRQGAFVALSCITANAVPAGFLLPGFPATLSDNAVRLSASAYTAESVHLTCGVT